MRKRLLAIIATATMVVTMIPAMAFAYSADLVINSKADLIAFRDAVNNGNDYAGKTVSLNANIDLEDAEWTPIGKGTRSGNTATPSPSGAAFEGTFNGNGKTISGLKITAGGSSDAVGLFGIVDGGTVKNIVLKDVEINTSSSKNVGAAIGIMVNDATAENINVSGTIIAPDGVGGIVGRMMISGEIINCSNKASVEATDNGGAAGGIVGKSYYTAVGKEMVIKNCKNEGIIKSNYAAGGISGLSSANTSDCVNTAAIIANIEAGGIIGEQTMYGTVNNNSNSGLISNKGTGGTAYGGIVGWARYANSTTDYPLYDAIIISNNVNSGNISAPGASLGSGGIVGSVYNQAVITGNENTATSIVGGVFSAGIAGGPQPANNNINIPGKSIDVYNNVSTTDLDDIKGTNRATDAYNNAPNEFKVAENNDTWVAQVGDTKYATFDKAIEAADREKKDLVILDMDGNDELNNVPAGVNVVNKTGENISVNGTTVPPTKNEPVAPAPSKPVDSPATGDNSMAPFAVAALALAAMAAVVATRRREN